MACSAPVEQWGVPVQNTWSKYVFRTVPQQDRGLGGRGRSAALLTVVITCVRAALRVSHAHVFPMSLHSCSMVTAKTILLSIGFIKKKAKGGTGSRKRQTERRNIEKKAAQGEKERSAQKEKIIRSLTRQGKKDAKKNDIKRLCILMTRGTEGAWIKKRGRRRKSIRNGNPRYRF